MHGNQEIGDLNHLINKVFIIIPSNTVGCYHESTSIETEGIKYMLILIDGDNVVKKTNARTSKMTQPVKFLIYELDLHNLHKGERKKHKLPSNLHMYITHTCTCHIIHKHLQNNNNFSCTGLSLSFQQMTSECGPFPKVNCCQASMRSGTRISACLAKKKMSGKLILVSPKMKWVGGYFYSNTDFPVSFVY